MSVTGHPPDGSPETYADLRNTAGIKAGRLRAGVSSQAKSGGGRERGKRTGAGVMSREKYEAGFDL